jgi:hypothetical protein
MNMMDKNQEAVLKKVRANKGKLCTKVCHEKISPSFAESTATDKSCHQTTDPVTSVIIPDFLVHETISVVPETIPSLSTTSIREETTKERRSQKNSNSFEAFLNEVI